MVPCLFVSVFVFHAGIVLKRLPTPHDSTVNLAFDAKNLRAKFVRGHTKPAQNTGGVRGKSFNVTCVSRTASACSQHLN